MPPTPASHLVVAPPGPLDRSALPWLRACTRRAYRALGGILALSVILQVLALVSPLAYQVVIDRVLAHASVSTLGVILAVLVVVAALEYALGTWRAQRQRELASQLDAELRLGVVWRSCCLAPELNRRWDSEAQQARLRDLDTLRQAWGGLWATAPADALAALVLWWALLGLAPRLAAATALACLAQVLLVWWMGQAAGQGEQGSRQERLALGDTLAALDTLHSHQALNTFLSRHGADFDTARAERFAELWRQTTSAEAQAMIQRLQGVAILGLGAQAVLQTELSLGGLVASNLLIGRINSTWQRLMGLATNWRDVTQAWRRMSRWAELPLDPLLNPAALITASVPAADAAASQGARPEVSRWHLEGLVCRVGAEPSRWLRCPEVWIEAGEWVVLTGPTGSGKSALARVLAGLDAPLAGQITLDSASPLATPPSTRSGAVWVGPELRLWQAGLDDNLSLFDSLVLSPASRVELQRALGIDRLRQQMGTHAEQGLARGAWRLSSGERARIQLYRAWCSKASLVIIDGLDLALTHHEERQLWQALQAMRLADRPAPAVLLVSADPECVPTVAQFWTIAAGQVRVRPAQTAEVRRRQ